MPVPALGDLDAIEQRAVITPSSAASSDLVVLLRPGTGQEVRVSFSDFVTSIGGGSATAIDGNSGTITLRGQNASAWTSANTVLAAREIGIETDTGYAKIGNGSTAWVDRAYLFQAVLTPAWATLLGAATASPTPGTLVLLDGSGRAQVEAPSAAKDIANKTWSEGAFQPLTAKLTGLAGMGTGVGAVVQTADNVFSTTALSASAVGLGSVTNDLQIKAALNYASKATPAAGDKLLILDQTGSVPKMIDWSQLPTLGGVAASSVTFTPTGAVAATTVQTAIAELDTEKSPLAGSGSIVTVGTLTGGDTTATVSAATTTLAGRVMLAASGDSTSTDKAAPPAVSKEIADAAVATVTPYAARVTSAATAVPAQVLRSGAGDQTLTHIGSLTGPAVREFVNLSGGARTILPGPVSGRALGWSCGGQALTSTAGPATLPTTALTISCWVNVVDSATATRQSILSTFVNGTSNSLEFGFFTLSSVPYFGIRVTADTDANSTYTYEIQAYCAAADVPDGVHHIDIGLNTATNAAFIVVDGVSKTVSKLLPSSQAITWGDVTKFSFGRRAAVTTSDVWKGSIAQFWMAAAYYDRTDSATGLKTYRSGQVDFGPTGTDFGETPCVYINTAYASSATTFPNLAPGATEVYSSATAGIGAFSGLIPAGTASNTVQGATSYSLADGASATFWVETLAGVKTTNWVAAVAGTTDLSGRQPLDATLTALAALNSDTGYLYQTGADLFTKLASPWTDRRTTAITVTNTTADILGGGVTIPAGTITTAGDAYEVFVPLTLSVPTVDSVTTVSLNIGGSTAELEDPLATVAFSSTTTRVGVLRALIYLFDTSTTHVLIQMFLNGTGTATTGSGNLAASMTAGGTMIFNGSVAFGTTEWASAQTLAINFTVDTNGTWVSQSHFIAPFMQSKLAVPLDPPPLVYTGGTHTLSRATHQGRRLIFKASDTTLTVSNSTDFENWTGCTITAFGGDVTVVAGSGVTIRRPGTDGLTISQYGSAYLSKSDAADDYVLVGRLA